MIIEMVLHRDPRDVAPDHQDQNSLRVKLIARAFRALLFFIFFVTRKMRCSMIEFPTVYGCQHPQCSVVRSVTSPNRSESPQCWVNLCQGWRDSENFPEHQDLALAFSPRNFVMRNFTMKHSIASKESLNRNGSREAIWQRAGRLRRPSPKEENHEVKMKRRFLTH